MAKLEVKKLKPGMVVEKAIVTKRGQTIAKVGTELDSKLIARLSFYKIEEVVVEDGFNDEPAKPLELEDVLPPKKEEPKEEPKKEPSQIRESMSYTSRLQSNQEFQDFQLSYSENMAALEETFDTIIFGDGNISEETLIKNAESLFASKTSIQMFDLLHCMKSIDDSVYAHSINVALISRAIGKWLKLSREQLNELTIAGLLHDIGKAEIPSEILNKTGKLTDEEFELIKSHALKGSKLLKKAGFNSDIQFAALQHHERSDGSGYPRGLEADEISDFASIIAILDIATGISDNTGNRRTTDSSTFIIDIIICESNFSRIVAVGNSYVMSMIGNRIRDNAGNRRYRIVLHGYFGHYSSTSQRRSCNQNDFSAIVATLDRCAEETGNTGNGISPSILSGSIY